MQKRELIDMPVSTLVWMAAQGGQYRWAATQYVADLEALIRLTAVAPLLTGTETD